MKNTAILFYFLGWFL